ncbi:hypothetical protein [Fimbriiglobus ruber]|uniref:Phage protein n=1 Tax=Fimbriiglobus ruber TaxID=1908690 RepID=A0A225D213_9BACT|nr:hypothetical protein [Fimbriiglobus ruber]OWK34973.1 hypothetical protein FRUB_09815 [Fimbriiglobus ruber]
MAEAKPKVFLTKAAIASNSKKVFPPAELPVPEWGGSVYLRRLSVDDVPAYSAAVKKSQDNGTDNLRQAVVMQAIVDENGTRLFDFEDAEDRATIAGLDLGGAERVFDAFLDMNGLVRKN